MRDADRTAVSALLRAGRFDGVEPVAALKRSAYYAPLLEAYDRLQTEVLYDSGVHGPAHVERVMLLGAIIAMQQGFSPRETELLLIACSYHDIGRVDDHYDAEHGRRSADMLPELPLPPLGEAELRCIRAAVATHSTHDHMIGRFEEEYRVPEEERALCRLLCRGLKDADNLDRVRLRDLDVRHLRFPESRRMAAEADEIFRLSRRGSRAGA